ncbi:MAG TPA: peptidoglycan-binding domain-containing protein, partial [Candidatus Paceibacterota bacterium]|nr:peptidoglycan-binding domain-containing protein [Candidatus Paceibacterota bacterium]
MKKIMISTVAAFAFLAIAGTVSAVNATEIYSSSTGFLKVGSGMGAKAYQNVNVKAAQTALNTCVPGSNLVVDGKFGPLTTGVFKAFQASKGIKVDGIIGSDTAAKLAACSGSMVIDNGSTVMSGTEGYLSNDVKLGAYNSTKVMEGDRDKVVFGFEVLAKDADQKIDGLSIALTNSNGASSKKITRYASEISVWLDGKEIGRKSVSNYSSDSSDVYTYRFTGMTGVIKQNMKGQVV